ncbi:uncharacterized protein BYT42DRAFT_562962 [Radiomyces spectabilis]|uniref:uncharacterized protein n=1 Tax=Radiomyces spectabilis TaxID=64574 RepID=UPI00222014E2|nr:uncharacterized protein BYT42DRAFT_562962 [Radiomyces spectabilis]KAI8384579.1 hypothetical protein BYT42DRAFT_562962 [Radiomyces spectabilis]
MFVFDPLSSAPGRPYTRIAPKLPHHSMPGPHNFVMYSIPVTPTIDNTSPMFQSESSLRLRPLSHRAMLTPVPSMDVPSDQSSSSFATRSSVPLAASVASGHEANGSVTLYPVPASDPGNVQEDGSPQPSARSLTNIAHPSTPSITSISKVHHLSDHDSASEFSSDNETDSDSNNDDPISDLPERPEEKKEWLKKWKFNDPEICCICYKDTCDDDNCFVYCDDPACEVIVHQNCYAVHPLPADDEPWYCQRCKAKRNDGMTPVVCALCPFTYGAFCKLEEPFCGMEWVHVSCATWLPCATIRDQKSLSGITLHGYPAANWDSRCSLCDDEVRAQYGACIKCTSMDCDTMFHVTCGLRYSYIWVLAFPYANVIRCGTHDCRKEKPLKGRRKRISPYDVWILQRDHFLQTHEGVNDGKELCLTAFYEAFSEIPKEASAALLGSTFQEFTITLQDEVRKRRLKVMEEWQEVMESLVVFRQRVASGEEDGDRNALTKRVKELQKQIKAVYASRQLMSRVNMDIRKQMREISYQILLKQIKRSPLKSVALSTVKPETSDADLGLIQSMAQIADSPPTPAAPIEEIAENTQTSTSAASVFNPRGQSPIEILSDGHSEADSATLPESEPTYHDAQMSQTIELDDDDDDETAAVVVPSKRDASGSSRRSVSPDDHASHESSSPYASASESQDESFAPSHSHNPDKTRLPVSLPSTSASASPAPARSSPISRLFSSPIAKLFVTGRSRTKPSPTPIVYPTLLSESTSSEKSNHVNSVSNASILSSDNHALKSAVQDKVPAAKKRKTEKQAITKTTTHKKQMLPGPPSKESHQGPPKSETKITKVTWHTHVFNGPQWYNDPNLVCTECGHHELPQEVLDRLHLSPEDMKHISETEHMRPAGYTGRGKFWDPRVFIECSACRRKLHCGCPDPPIKNYPSKNEAFVCVDCDPTLDEEGGAKEVESEPKERFRRRKTINYKV